MVKSVSPNSLKCFVTVKFEEYIELEEREKERNTHAQKILNTSDRMIILMLERVNKNKLK